MKNKASILSKYDAGAKVCYGMAQPGAHRAAMYCARVVYNATRVCPSCGHEFYPSKAKKNEAVRASDVPINFGELR